MLRLILAPTIGAAALAIVAAPQPTQAGRPETAPGLAATTAQLRLNRDVEVDDRGTRVRLRMIEVNDSRCPSDLVCIRAGEATAVVTVTPLAPGQAGKASTVTLMLPGQPQAGAGVTLRLTAVEPYPKASQPTPPAVVVAIVSVTKS